MWLIGPSYINFKVIVSVIRYSKNTNQIRANLPHRIKYQEYNLLFRKVRGNVRQFLGIFSYNQQK
jgi:hypothetical protein